MTTRRQKPDCSPNEGKLLSGGEKERELDCIRGKKERSTVVPSLEVTRRKDYIDDSVERILHGCWTHWSCKTPEQTLKIATWKLLLPPPPCDWPETGQSTCTLKLTIE